MTCSFIVSMDQLPPLPAPPAPPSLPALPPLPDFTVMQPFPPMESPEDLPKPPDVTPPEAASLDDAPAGGWMSSAAADTVGDVMNSMGQTASSSQGAALSGLSALAGMAGGFTPIAAPAIERVNVELPTLHEAPVAPDLAPSFPSLPDAPRLGEVPRFTPDAPPTFDAGTLLVADLPLPDPLTVLMPDAPDLLDVVAPPPPDFVLPPAPTLATLDVPDPPVLQLPVFDAEPGARPDLPYVEFAYAEAEYHSTLLSSMQSRLAGLILDARATGLTPEVADAIWRRGADREAILTYRATGEAMRVLRARGFAMPAATLNRMVQQALQGGLARSSGFARAVAIERANLAQQNLRFAIESTISLESALIGKHNAAQARLLDAAKAMLQTEIQLFNAQVKLMSADVAAFAMKAEVFKTRLTAALANVSVYRAQIEAQLARGEVNAQRIAIYQAQVGGVKVIADTYRSQVEAAQQMTEANKARADQYQARISAYQAQVTAKQSDYDRFAAGVRAQAERAQVFEKQVGAYRAQVGAFDALVKAQVGVLDLQLKQDGEFPLEVFRAKIEAWRGSADTTVEQLRAAATIYNTRIRAYVAAEGAKTDVADASVRVAQANVEGALAEAGLLIEAGRANIAALEAQARMVQDNIRIAGQLAGQMSAAAIGAQSVHASISHSASVGTSNSAGVSVSSSVSHAASNTNSNSVSLNESHTRISGKTFNNVVSNSAGRHRNKGVSTSESIAYSNNTGNSTTIHYTNSSSTNRASNFSSSNECVDRTIKSD